jgi:hypothetical protein
MPIQAGIDLTDTACTKLYNIIYLSIKEKISSNRLKFKGDIAGAPPYYVFVEEEHKGSRYGENEGGPRLIKSVWAPDDCHSISITHGL